MFWSKVDAGLLGMAAGSAVGVPADCRSRSFLEENPVTCMEGFGTYNLPPGYWSDAVSMSCCLAEALCTGSKRSLIIEKLILWRDTGYWTPDGEVVGVWNPAQEAVRYLKQRVRGADSCSLNKDEFVYNTSLGWVLPLAYVTYGLTPQQRIKIIKDISSLTNTHQRSLLGCIMYNEIAVRVLHGMPFDDAVVGMQLFMHNRFAEDEEMSRFSRIMSGRIVGLKKEDVNASNYLVDTLEACLWSLLNSRNFEEAVLLSVNLGHDPDTLGAVTGGLAGMLYGTEAIPSAWMEKLSRLDDLKTLAEQFSRRMHELDMKRKDRSAGMPLS